MYDLSLFFTSDSTTNFFASLWFPSAGAVEKSTMSKERESCRGSRTSLDDNDWNKISEGSCSVIMSQYGLWKKGEDIVLGL
ncbi:hypothetical protein VIGAN_08204700 [Vigna angularis var. angularis]|uniref:Uncharacterized protein n=1 Tax=Vigna angularis var. angularis TaxID=157739 RepID=A0A0S3SR80_PHAAN|nr:hypothetical protein VIGAN_08204700 [Vigna angularis var. angularis]